MDKKSDDRKGPGTANSGTRIDKIRNTDSTTGKEVNHMPLAPAINDMLGAKLRAYYSAILSEPMPDGLATLMAELEAQSTANLASDHDKNGDP